MSTLLADTTALPAEALAGEAITIDGTLLHIGKLGLNQWMALTRLAIATVERLPKEKAADMVAMANRLQKTGAKAMPEREMIQAGVTWILTFLDQDTVAAAFSVVTRQPEVVVTRWCDGPLGLEEAIEIVLALLKHNPPERFLALFRQAGAALSSLPSPRQPSGADAN